MKQNTNSIGFLERLAKTLQEFVELLISPWRHKATVKSLQKRIDILEKQVYQNLQNNTEQRLLAITEKLQNQLDEVQDNTKNRLDKLVEYELGESVLKVLKEQTYLIGQAIKPTVEVLLRELEEKKQRSPEIFTVADIQQRQDKLTQSLAQIEELIASLPHLEAKTAACLSAGHWLLARRVKLAEQVADEILTPQHPEIEEFRRHTRQYLKLLGHCLENGIQPRLLYQGVISHQQPPIDIYLQAFKLIRNKYIDEWELTEQVSPQAADELRGYFSYLINYLANC